jgi:D-aminopeptidase
MQSAGGVTSPPAQAGPGRARARDLGIAIGELPTGPANAITDVPGVLVGHCTVSWGDAALPTGRGPARTGVTAVLAHGGDLFHERVRAGVFAANGVGEVVGSTPIREWGLIETPILLTNSQSMGVAYDAAVRWMMARDPLVGVEDVAMPVVGECDDSLLNDARGMHVLPEHVLAALDSAAAGPVTEGCVGAGTGMVCYDFKGGIGTSSRIVHAYDEPFTLGVLVLTNLGRRSRLVVDGVPVGRQIADLMPLEHHEGSCIVVCATDAPLSSRQCERLAKRCSLGLAVTGSYASDSSGEIMLAFSTAVRLPRTTSAPLTHVRIGDDAIDEFFEAAADATAEAVINSLCAAVTTEGRKGSRVFALPLDRLSEIMVRFGRPALAVPPDGTI